MWTEYSMIQHFKYRTFRQHHYNTNLNLQSKVLLDGVIFGYWLFYVSFYCNLYVPETIVPPSLKEKSSYLRRNEMNGSQTAQLLFYSKNVKLKYDLG
jgi:hypothetical protein